MSSATVKRDLDTDESTMHTAGPSSKKPKFEETSSDGPNGVESLDQLENPRATGSSINPSKREEPKRRKDFRNQDWGRKVGRNASDEEPREEGEKSIRYPKKKIAMLMSFCGTGCSGMQYQTNAQTIEGYLFDALVNAGAISKDNSNNPNKVDLQRSARTDAGVHAAGNVVSLKMITAPPIQPLNDAPNPPLHTTSSLISQINSLLPPQIRVWSFCRTRNKFNARMECDSRKYEYLFPSWMLLPPKPQSALGNRIWEERRATDATPLRNQSFWEEVVTNPTSIDETADYMQDLNRKRAWRVDAETLERFRAMIIEYEGTRNFWNYTIGREFMERQSQRYMIKLEVLDPQIIQGTEWISVRFHGQSFMLHQ
ncbi:tRNA pseudouridine synthase 1 [Tulasnella sp. 418]|nr:tRNA pseudouridine synthase 1 [Tulasnella sp. 418]